MQRFSRTLALPEELIVGSKRYHGRHSAEQQRARDGLTCDLMARKRRVVLSRGWAGLAEP
jgi:hypothetical protein